MKEQNAVITEFSVVKVKNGDLIPSITLDFGDGQQVFSSNPAFVPASFMAPVMIIAGVDKWEDLCGKPVIAVLNNLTGKVVGLRPFLVSDYYYHQGK